ncbi:MAG: tetratricopeptide repeat protein [Planctomycetes bacterium]|nr:tetratricopeptide repeat protein [Planctomycetota bacterium]
MDGPAAETEYFFRHAVTRDAAYQLILPTERDALHEIAGNAMESLFADEHELALRSAEIAHHFRVASRSVTGLAAREARFVNIAGTHAERGYANRKALEWWLRLAEVGDDAARLVGTHRAGCMAVLMGDVARGEELLTRALNDAVAQGSTRHESMALGELANVFWYTAREDKAIEYCRRAIELAASVNDEPLRGTTTGTLAIMLSRRVRDLRLDSASEAEALFDEALSIARDSGDVYFHAMTLAAYGSLYMWRDNARARAYYEQAIDIAQEGREPRVEGMVLSNLGIIAAEEGRTSEAERLYTRAIEINERCGIQHALSVTLGNLGNLCKESGRHAEAERHYLDGLRIARNIGDARSEYSKLENYINMLCDTGRAGEARVLVQDFMAHRMPPDRTLQGMCYCDLACIHASLGHEAEARHDWQAGIERIAGSVRDAEIESRKRQLSRCCDAGGIPHIV